MTNISIPEPLIIYQKTQRSFFKQLCQPSSIDSPSIGHFSATKQINKQILSFGPNEFRICSSMIVNNARPDSASFKNSTAVKYSPICCLSYENQTYLNTRWPHLFVKRASPSINYFLCETLNWQTKLDNFDINHLPFCRAAGES